MRALPSANGVWPTTTSVDGSGLMIAEAEADGSQGLGHAEGRRRGLLEDTARHRHALTAWSVRLVSDRAVTSTSDTRAARCGTRWSTPGPSPLRRVPRRPPAWPLHLGQDGVARRPADITVAATHGLLVGDAPERLGRLPPGALPVTNSVSHNAGATIAPLLADAIARLHHGQIPAGSCPGLTPPAAEPPAADHSVDG